jgi:hypothetical protein
VQKVGVDAERGLAALVLGDRDLVLLGEVQQVFAALELPFTPGRDDADVGLKVPSRYWPSYRALARNIGKT